MATIQDITVDKLESWDKFKDKPPEEALSYLYTYIENISAQMRAWYWSSIRVKRFTSLAARSLSFFFLFLGMIFPLISTLEPISKFSLIFMQLAIICLIVAGLIRLADRIFGWSSGWMRYITVVTQMENLTRNFQLDWAKHFLVKSSLIDSTNINTLFELAKCLEQDLTKLQTEETVKWVTEFNSSIALIDTMIKMQRDESDKNFEIIQTKLATETVLKAEKKAKIPGALEVTLIFKSAPSTIKIGIDNEIQKEFLGSSWARMEIAPGRHIIRITTTLEPIQTIERIVDIKPGTLEKLNIQWE